MNTYSWLFQRFDFDEAVKLSIELAKQTLHDHIDRLGFFIYINTDALPHFSWEEWLRLSKEIGMLPVAGSMRIHNNDHSVAIKNRRGDTAYEMWVHREWPMVYNPPRYIFPPIH